MARTINAHLLPSLIDQEELAGSTVVVIDVLRATTTIIHALAAGAIDITPCLEVEEARRLKEADPREMLLGGEREGKRIDGFDLGNSPAEYTAERVGGRRIAFTTTNGTRAMRHCQGAKQVFIGAFTNFSALCRQLGEADQVDLLCAGTGSEITREDVLLAGAVANELIRSAPEATLNDQAAIAAGAWNAASENLASGQLLAAALRRSLGARHLIEIGMQNDIDIAATIDRYDLNASLDLASGRITALP